MLQGRCEPGFEPVFDVMDHQLCEGQHLGIGLHVIHHGISIVDVFGGVSNRAHKTPWQRNTLVNIFSASKAFTALSLHQCVADGLCQYDDLVVSHWPEFAIEHSVKASIRICDLLNHTAGLPAIETALADDDLYSWSAMVKALEQQDPLWVPRQAMGYHPITSGWLWGELVARLRQQPFEQVIQERIVTPLSLDFSFGLSPENLSRKARVYPAKAAGHAASSVGLLKIMACEPKGITTKAFTNPATIFSGANGNAWCEAIIPAANGFASAVSLAAFYHGFLDDSDPFGVAKLREQWPQYTIIGDDQVLKEKLCFELGFIKNESTLRLLSGVGEGAFGHPGAGGTLGFVDPGNELAFGLTLNQMGPDIMLDERVKQVMDTLYQCL